MFWLIKKQKNTVSKVAGRVLIIIYYVNNESCKNNYILFCIGHYIKENDLGLIGYKEDYDEISMAGQCKNALI